MGSTVSTPEEAIKDGANTRTQFILDGIREYLKQIWVAMHGDKDRGPEDYDIRRDERRALTSVLRDLLKEIRQRPPPSMNNGDDSGSIKKWIAGVGAVLAAAFIIAGWTISTQVASQSVQLDYQNAQLRELNARVTRIEQQQSDRR
jgi:hypothetical protein